MMKKPKIAILISKNLRAVLFSSQTEKQLRQFAKVVPSPAEAPIKITFKDTLKIIKDAVGCITGWGTPRLEGEILKAAPELKLISHAAGTVKGIVSDEVWERGILVTSAAAVIARGVAEFTLAMMIMALKKAFWYNAELHRRRKWRKREVWSEEVSADPYNITVGVIGASKVGREFIKLLKQLLKIKILVYDPYLSSQEAKKIGVAKVSLRELMSKSDVVSLHAPALESTRDMINADNLKLLKDGAIFINTARGALVDESALIKELKTGRITACLDVFKDEPLPLTSELRKLPNVILTPHIAGYLSRGLERLGESAVEEQRRVFVQKKKPLHLVTKEMLERIA
jgi:phosphoglycerate dehydrogenase-like enzyme